MSLEQRKQQCQSLGNNLCASLRGEVSKLGLPVDCIDPDMGRAEFTLSRDPASGEDSLIGVWRDHQGQKQGEILFHADGSFFAEYDVIAQHPKKPQWFVEGVAAWGRDNVVKAEAKLLPMASE